MKQISKENLDEVQLEAFMRRFQGFMPRRRLVVLPMLAWPILLLLVNDGVVWRSCTLGAIAVVAVVGAVTELVRGNWLQVKMRALRGSGWLVSSTLIMAAFIVATGGIDGPVLPFLMPLCFFAGTFAPPRRLIPVVAVSMTLVAVLAAVAVHGWIPDLMPVVFGGGPALPQPRALLCARAAVFAFIIGWSSVAAHGLRQVFRDIVGEVLDARDEVLSGHDAHARELTALSGELAHELKNPLANLKGLAVLVGRDVQGKGVERLSVLQHEVVRMEEILQGFLTFSRPLSPLNAERVDMNKLLDSALALHEGVAHAKNVSLAVHAPGPVSSSCDSRKVKQILINLIQNALEASPAGAEVELVLTAEPGGGARLEVSDRGAGIPEEVRARLFQPGTTTKERGTGLGLALARGLARQHGGELLLENREGGGCTATLRLPGAPRLPRRGGREMTARILIVDDDAVGRYTLRNLLEEEGLAVEEAPDGQAALDRLTDDAFDLVISDLRMPRLDGMELLRRAQALAPPPRIIMLTAHGSERHAVEAMKLGALDYFRKPFEIDEVLTVVRRSIATLQLERENEQLRGEVNLLHSLVFVSPAMSRLALLVKRVGPRDVTVLITGESGTGKERLAEAIVRASRRAERPFVRFNCAALTPELAEAELFGHARGAFTGAVRARNGLFREAEGGTLLLDEVGELDTGAQAKLLRVLQQGEVRPLGEDRTHHVDARILAATNRDLSGLVAAGRFREDLFYRLKVVTLQVPPLRERPEDIPVLARHFLSRAARRFGVAPVRMTPELLARLAAYSWPGNVRELENAIESAVALSPDGALDLELLPGASSASRPAPTRFKELVAAYERGLIVTALDAAKGNQSEAARLLDMGRATLQDKLRKHGLKGSDGEEPGES